MKGDFTRSTFKPEKRYSSVRMQQGRVQLDADWNEQTDINSHRIEKEALDIIGPCGVPLEGGGFEIKIDTASGDENLIISQGSIYVDGILCENFRDINITSQEDLPNFSLFAPEGVYLAYLDVWQHHITAIEDPQIREVALGGPDTATRTKTVWQVKLKKLENYTEPPEENGPIDCQTVNDEWGSIIEKSDGQLAAFTKTETPTKNPCIISPNSGYRRLENQLYRVEIHKGGNADEATFKWSHDNGSVVFAIEEFIKDGNGDPTNKLKVKHLGRDKIFSLKAGDWVEVLDDAKELSENPAGTLAEIFEIDVAERVITLNHPPISGDDFKLHPRVRRWDQKSDAIPVKAPSQSDSIELEDGIYVRFSGNNFKTGDYWLIPARTATENTQETGKIEWPRDELQNPPELFMPPEGIVHHYCRLALLEQDNNKKWSLISDCRKRFPPVTELTSFFHVCGDGQEAMPGEELPELLQVGVSSGNYPVKDALIKFEVINGGGIVSAENPVSQNPLIVKTDSEGVAKCEWKLGILDSTDPNVPPTQLAEAKLLNACHNPIDIPPIRFSANLSVASQVAYTLTDCEESTCTRIYAYVTNKGSNSVSVIDTAADKVTATVPVGDEPEGVAVTSEKVYVTNFGSDNVSVIDTATNKVTVTIPVGSAPLGITVTPDRKKVYVANFGSGDVSVIDTITNTTATVPVGVRPTGIAVSPDGKKVYVSTGNDAGVDIGVSVIDTTTNTVIAKVNMERPFGIAVSPDGKKVYVTNATGSPDISENVSVIDTSNNAIIATVPVGGELPVGIAVTPDGTKVYVTSSESSIVSVIDTTTNTTATIPVEDIPLGVAVTPDGTKVYVATPNSDKVSVIDTSTDTVITTVPVGSGPDAFGQYIGKVTSTFTTVKSLFEKKIPDWPPVNETGNASVKEILDTFLCDFNAAHLPLDCNLCTILNDAEVKTVQDALNKLCRGLGGRGCCITVSNADELENALRELTDGDTICLLAGEFNIGSLSVNDHKNIVIRGCTLASKLIADIKIIDCQNIVIENLDISGSISVQGGENFSLKRNKTSKAVGKILDVKDCSGTLIESNVFETEGEEGLVFERTDDLKMYKNTIKTNLSTPDNDEISILIKDSQGIEITGNQIQIFGNVDLIERATVLGISLEGTGGYVSIANNRINAINGPSLKIIESKASVTVHENFFGSRFRTLGTDGTVDIEATRNQVIFTDNLCDSQSRNFEQNQELSLISIKSINTIFSNNHCVLIADTNNFRTLKHVSIPNGFANVIGNRCEENIRVNGNIFSISARRGSSILLGNITTNNIEPTPDPNKLNLFV